MTRLCESPSGARLNPTPCLPRPTFQKGECTVTSSLRISLPPIMLQLPLTGNCHQIVQQSREIPRAGSTAKRANFTERGDKSRAGAEQFGPRQDDGSMVISGQSPGRQRASMSAIEAISVVTDSIVQSLAPAQGDDPYSRRMLVVRWRVPTGRPAPDAPTGATGGGSTWARPWRTSQSQASF
jgi:hypothetical protein